MENESGMSLPKNEVNFPKNLISLRPALHTVQSQWTSSHVSSCLIPVALFVLSPVHVNCKQQTKVGSIARKEECRAGEQGCWDGHWHCLLHSVDQAMHPSSLCNQLSVHLSIGWSACLSVCQVTPWDCLTTLLSLSVCLYVYLSVSLFVFWSV